MRRVLSVLVLVAAAVGTGGAGPAGAPAALAAAAAPSREAARADFDGDGFVDLAVGIPDEDVEARGGAGAVNVLYGSAAGLTGARAQLFHQDLPQLVDRAEIGDAFGAALAAGDLNGDGFADLAVGVPGEEYFANPDVGDAIVLRGTAGGLSGAGSGSLTEDFGNPGANESGDHIGASLAARDFDADGAGDLVVGMPGEDIDKLREAGAVAYNQGLLDGPNRSESRPLHADSAGVPGASEPGDHFGSVLAPGPLGG